MLPITEIPDGRDLAVFVADGDGARSRYTIALRDVEDFAALGASRTADATTSAHGSLDVRRVGARGPSTDSGAQGPMAARAHDEFVHVTDAAPRDRGIGCLRRSSGARRGGSTTTRLFQALRRPATSAALVGMAGARSPRANAALAEAGSDLAERDRVPAGRQWIARSAVGGCAASIAPCGSSAMCRS